MAHLQLFSTLLRDAGVNPKLKKRWWLAEKIIYLGYVIGPRLLERSEAATAAVRKLKDPETQA